MCEKIRFNDLNPTFLFCWKGARTRDEVNYHCHSNHIEMSLIVSGSGRYRINDVIYDVSEGDLLIFNPGVYHQALTDGSGNPAVEFLWDLRTYSLKAIRLTVWILRMHRLCIPRESYGRSF